VTCQIKAVIGATGRTVAVSPQRSWYTLLLGDRLQNHDAVVHRSSQRHRGGLSPSTGRRYRAPTARRNAASQVVGRRAGARRANDRTLGGP
jgi:hypothetical protein